MPPQTPRPGEIWRHYKGTKYCSVLGIATPIERVETRGLDLVAMARLTDRQELARSIWRDATGSLRFVPVRFMGGTVLSSDIVVYACSGGIWLRISEEFCEKFTLVDFDAAPLRNTGGGLPIPSGAGPDTPLIWN